MRQAMFLAQFVEGALTVSHRTRVAPNDARPQHFLVLVHTHQPVHLIRDADGHDVFALGTGLMHDFSQRELRIVPPHLRVLFRPARPYGYDGRLFFRIEGRCRNVSALDVYQRCLDRTAADIKPQ